MGRGGSAHSDRNAAAQPEPGPQLGAQRAALGQGGQLALGAKQGQPQRTDVSRGVGRGTEAPLERGECDPLRYRPPAAGEGPLDFGEQRV